MVTLREATRALIDAARPFLSESVVDETSGTIPLLNALELAIDVAEKAVADAAVRITKEE